MVTELNTCYFQGRTDGTMRVPKYIISRWSNITLLFRRAFWVHGHAAHFFFGKGIRLEYEMALLLRKVSCIKYCIILSRGMLSAPGIASFFSGTHLLHLALHH